MLTGPRITLRPVTRDDLPRYVKWLHDPDVARHLLGFNPFNLDDEHEWYEKQRKDPNTLNFAIETEHGEHIGSVGLSDIDRLVQSAELGIVIGHKPAWNQGYGTEAILVLLNYAFNEQNMNRIMLQVDTDHPAGIKVYKRCGFVMEGEMRHVAYREGKHINQYIMSILQHEYLTMTAPGGNTDAKTRQTEKEST